MRRRTHLQSYKRKADEHVFYVLVDTPDNDGTFARERRGSTWRDVMSYASKGLVFGLALHLLLAPQTGSAQGQQAQSDEKPKVHNLNLFPYGRARRGCQPVEVKSIVQYARPPLGDEVVIESFSEKAVTAVKLGWYVF